MSEQAPKKEPIGVSAPAETTLTEPFTAEEQLKVRGELKRDAEGLNGKHEATEKRKGLLGKLGLRKATETPTLPADTGHELPATTEEADPELSERLDATVPTAEDVEQAEAERREVIAQGLADTNTSDEDKHEAA